MILSGRSIISIIDAFKSWAAAVHVGVKCIGTRRRIGNGDAGNGAGAAGRGRTRGT